MTHSQPQRFGPYVILDRIGDGGMAEIFLAKMQGYSGFEKLIALKKIHPKYSRNETFAQMLIHEAKLAAALNHFNVVQVHDLGEIDGQVYIAMEYVRGRDLAAVLSNTYRRDERLPIELSLFVATEFLTGLEYAHRMRANDGTPLGIIHRDISPQNVLISYEGEVKVTDFGIARVIAGKEAFQLPGNLHGKFGYMSPEQALNREIDQRSDVFSAGVVLWEMLVGARLFRGRDQHETINMVTSKEVPPPSSLNPEVPEEVDRICTKALSRDRRLRYQTMGALLGELSRVAEERSRRAGSRDLSVYMRRQFGTPGGGFLPGRASNRVEPSSISQHSGFQRTQAPLGASSSGESRVPIGQILLEQGSINVGELELGLAEQRAQGGRIGEVLVSTAVIDDTELAKALAAQTNLPTLSTEDLEALPRPSNLISRFPRHAAEASCILPIAADPQARTLRLAVCDPFDERGVLEAKVVLGVNEVALLVAPRNAIRETLASWYGPGRDADGPVDLEPIFVETGDEALTDEMVVPVISPRVLIADADVTLAETLAERIQREGYDVDVVHDGKAARERIRIMPPAVAFFDASLPGIDGYNLLLEVRSSSAEAAVFITSSRGDEFRQAKALELGADDFLVKPLGLEVTTSKIRRELQRRSSVPKRPEPSATPSSGVNGSLEDMTFIDIAQSLELGRKTGHVVVQYDDGRQGVLRVDDGIIVGCSTRGLQGADAFYFLAQPGTGQFRIEYRSSPLPPNINEGNTFLMIEAMRHLDEGTVPSPQLGFVPEAPLPSPRRAPPSLPPPPPSTPSPAPVPLAPPPAAISVAGIEAIPLGSNDLEEPRTSDLATEDTESKTAPLEAWIDEQLERPRKPSSKPEAQPESEGSVGGTEVARITLRRSQKPE